MNVIWNAEPSIALADAARLTCGPCDVQWSANDAIAVALACGMQPSEDLDYLYEGRGPRTLPTLAAVICGAWFVPLLQRLGVDGNAAVAGEVRVTMERPLPAEGTASVVARVLGVDMRRDNACLTVEAQADGLATVRTVTFLRGVGGTGFVEGDVSRVVRCDQPAVPPVRRMTYAIPRTAAAIYRMLFPLRAGVPYADAAHIDPARCRRAGFERPVLHGLTVLGMAARAILGAAGSERPVSMLEGRFVRGVEVGGTLHVDLWQETPNAWRAELRDAQDEIVMCGVRAAFGNA
jgi:acyl dehydratase